jgi:hypothetical protein
MSTKTSEPFAAIKSARAISKGQEDPTFQPVQEFLQRFGYLRAGSYRARQLDDATSQALTRYQQFHRLTATGILDDPTRAQMTTHRCGLPDVAPFGVRFSTRCSWPNPSLTFAFVESHQMQIVWGPPRPDSASPILFIHFVAPSTNW